jgi:hypothetical protein
MSNAEPFPWRHIAVEIVEIIFIFCLPTTLFIEPDAHAAPLLLCNVSRTWRQIAQSTPLLWASLNASSRSLKNVNLVETWLTRAGAHPLSLEIHTIPCFSDPLTVFRIFLRHLPRCKRFKLIVESDYFHVFADAMSSPEFQEIPPLPLLESIDVLFYRLLLSPHHFMKLFYAIVASAPLISEFRYAGDRGVLSYVWLVVPWIQLTSVSLYCGLRPEEGVEILRLAPNLSEIAMCFTFTDIPPRTPVPFVVHLRLRQLRIEAAAVALPILDHLTLPALQKFAWRIFGGLNWSAETQPKLHPFHALVARSSCHLKHLELNTLIIRAELLDCAQVCGPSLVKFVVDKKDYDLQSGKFLDIVS